DSAGDRLFPVIHHATTDRRQWSPAKPQHLLPRRPAEVDGRIDERAVQTFVGAQETHAARRQVSDLEATVAPGSYMRWPGNRHAPSDAAPRKSTSLSPKSICSPAAGLPVPERTRRPLIRLPFGQTMV